MEQLAAWQPRHETCDRIEAGMVCLDELVLDDGVLRRSHAGDCSDEDEGFDRAIEDFVLS
jgi:hypothetical protein